MFKSPKIGSPSHFSTNIFFASALVLTFAAKLKQLDDKS